MPHVLVVDIDEETIAAIEDLVSRRTNMPPLVRINSDTGTLPLGNGADEPTSCVTRDRMGHDGRPGSSISGPAADAFRRDSRAVLMFASWRLDLTTQQLTGKDDASVPLSRAEFELLYVLAKHPHRWLTRAQILQFMNSHSRLSQARSIDVYISRLRRKLEVDVHSPMIIQTVRNGYKFASSVTIR